VRIGAQFFLFPHKVCFFAKKFIFWYDLLEKRIDFWFIFCENKNWYR